MGTKVSEESVASINMGSRFPQKVGTNLPTYTAALPEKTVTLIRGA
jgi:hypothetical protein